MTGQEIIDVIKALKESGAIRFKSGDLEIDFVAPISPVPGPISPTVQKNYAPTSLKIAPAIPETEAPHIVQQMRSLFKTSDAELIEQLFPLPQAEEVG